MTEGQTVGTGPVGGPDVTAADTTARPAGDPRWRRVIVGILFLVTLLAMVVTTMLVWSHQVLLRTDRYMTVVERVSTDPAVIAAVSDRLATQTVTALDVEQRIATVLPDRAQFLAAPITAGIENRAARGLETLFSDPRVQNAWLSANEVAHDRLVALLRGQTDIASIQDGALTIDLLPLTGVIIEQLQAQGIIPASLTLPDLSAPDARERLGAVLGVTIPPDFATVTLLRSDALTTAQQAVRIYDLMVIVALLLTIALAVITVLLARRRTRMVWALALGAAIAYVVALLVIVGVQNAIVSTLATSQGQVTATSLIHDLIGDLTAWMRAIAAIAVILAIAIYLASGPRWLTRITERFGRRSGHAGESAAEPSDA